MKLGTLVLPLCLIGLVACQSGTKNHELPKENQVVETPTPVPTPVPSQTPTPTPTPLPPYSRPGPSNFKAVLIDGENPNEYSVKLTWDWSKRYRGKFRIVRTDLTSKDDSGVESVELDSSAREYLNEVGLRNGVKYSYSITVENQVGSVGEYEVLIPTDLVFSKESNRPSKYTKLVNETYYFSVHRVFFFDDTEIVLDGKNLEINTDIISYESIRLSAFDNKVESRNLGRDGSNVSIFAEEYRKPIARVDDDQFNPKLIIDLSGENGKNGEPGKNGIVGGFRDCANYRYHDGGDGNSGGNGGNGGNAVVKIKRYDYQNSPVVELKSKGGEMGTGGAAGAAGNGYMVRGWECPNYRKPIPGQKGNDGVAGKNGVSKIIIGDHVIAD
jgi:hypothetical protein